MAKTVSKFVVLTYNGQAVTGITSITGAGINYPEIDFTDMASVEKFVAAGIPECKIELKGFLDNTASVGSHTVLSASAVLGNQTGAALTIDYGMMAAPITGVPRLSNTLMWVQKYAIDVSGVNSSPQFSATLCTNQGAVFSWTTKP